MSITSQQLIRDRIEELRENTDVVDALLESLIGYAIIAADFNGNIIAFNEGARQMYGYGPEEIIGKQDIEIFFPEDFIEDGKLQEIIDDLIDKGRFSYEGEKVRKSGERFPAQILFTLTKDKNRKVVGFIEIVADLTERKRAERMEALQDRANFRKVITASADGIIVIGQRGIMRFVNPAAESLFARKAKDLLGKQFGFPVVAGETTELDIVRRDRETAVAEMRVVETEWEGKTAYLASLRDITERKRAEQLLRDSHEQSCKLVESITDGVIMLDGNLEVAIVNPSALSIINSGDSASHPDAKMLQSILGVDFRELKELFGKGEGNFVQKEIERFSHTYEALVSPIKRVEEAFTGFVVSLRDVTEEKRLDNLKSEFISVASHELRTPLTSIKNAVDILSSGKTGEINENQGKFLSMASRNVNRLTRIINDFLDISKMEAGKMDLRLEEVNLSQIIDGTISTFALNAKEKSIQLKKELSADLPQILGDADKLVQVLSNLLSNAVKHTPERGEICIKATSINKSKSPIPAILSLPHQDFVKVEVKDTGAGIPSDELERVFDKFYQVENSLSRKVTGTGLGLPICKKLVEAHGGGIWAESKLNKGSRFVFVLPLLQKMQCFEHHLSSIINQAKSASPCLSLVVLKVKHLEVIKGKLGTERKRKVFEAMVELAQKTLFKSSDHVQPDKKSGRVFIVLENTPKEGALAVCKRLKENVLSHDFSIDGGLTELELSLGIASYPDDARNAKELRQRAERSSYFPNLAVGQRISKESGQT